MNNTYLKGYWHPYVHSNIIPKSQNKESIYIPSSRYLGKEAGVYRYSGQLTDDFIRVWNIK